MWDALTAGEEGKERVHAVAKRYLCITWGAPPAKQGRIVHALKLDEHHRYRVKMRVADGEPDALAAATRYEVLATRHRPGDPSSIYALVACDLESGRQHQIRAHLAHAGFPIVGDKLYTHGDDAFIEYCDEGLTDELAALFVIPRHALHAAKITLPHPDGGTVTAGAPLPQDLAALLA